MALASERVHIAAARRAAPRPGPGARGAHPLSALQRRIGNRAVQRLVGRTKGQRSRAEGLAALHGAAGNLAAGGLLQRRLYVEGSSADVVTLLDLLRGASGLTLAHSATGLVTILEGEDEGNAAASPTLHARLLQVIGDANQDARVSAEHAVPGFGIYGETQRVDASAAEQIEARARGAGAAMVIHEIWENYQGHAQAQLGPFAQAHAQAIRVENAVAGELSQMQGARVATASSDGVSAFDYGTYFLVLEGLGGRHVNASRARREVVASTSIVGWQDGSAALPDSAEATIASAVDVLEDDGHLLATARVEAHGPGNVNAQRAQAVSAELEDGLDSEDRVYVRQGTADGTPRVTITIEQPEREGPIELQDQGPDEAEEGEAKPFVSPSS